MTSRFLPDHEGRLARAQVCLEGLSVGDAFGQRFFVSPTMVESLIEQRAVPPSPWYFTDDTVMALSVVEVLREHGGIDRDALARAFGARYAHDPSRGYGGTAHGILAAIASGTPWREAAGVVFGGQGSMGNGAAMRSGPVGAYFAGDLDEVVGHARGSADPTHLHPDGAAGAVAVAVAAAVAWQSRGASPEARREELWARVIERTPEGPTREGLERARQIPSSYDVRTAASALGSGSQVISSDTVPFSIWCAARHLDDFEEALWATVSGLGDRDTTCAIVGGIVASGGAAIPPEYLASREPLDSTLREVDRSGGWG